MITTSTGTVVKMNCGKIILDNPAAPDDMRDLEVGRIIGGGYQPAFFAPWALTPEVLRAIADLIEARTTSHTQEEE